MLINAYKCLCNIPFDSNVAGKSNGNPLNSRVLLGEISKNQVPGTRWYCCTGWGRPTRNPVLWGNRGKRRAPTHQQKHQTSSETSPGTFEVSCLFQSIFQRDLKYLVMLEHVLMMKVAVDEVPFINMSSSSFTGHIAPQNLFHCLVSISCNWNTSWWKPK